jgi:CTP:molybdopterin cytidylyltransferase MocA
MGDMPQVNPRDMAAKTLAVSHTHRRIREAMHEKAEAQERVRREEDARLNAASRLEGKTP